MSTATTTGARGQKLQLKLDGNINVSLKLFIATEDAEGSGLHLGCPEQIDEQGNLCLGSISMPKTCAVHGKIGEKTVEVYREGDTVYQITDEDKKLLTLDTDKTFIINSIPKLSDVSDLIPESTKKYFMVPDGKGSELNYALILDYLNRSKSAIIGKYSNLGGRNKREILAAIVSEGDMLVLLNLPFAAQCRPRPDDMVLPDVKKAERDGFKQIMGTHSSTFDYDAVVDEYDEQLAKLVTMKAAETIAKKAKEIKMKKDDFISLEPSKKRVRAKK